MALEDAWVLADEVTSPKSIEVALAAYQLKRKDRAKRIIDTASNNAWKYHLSSPPVRWAAHAGMRVLGKVAPNKLLGQFDWIYDHDVTKSP